MKKLIIAGMALSLLAGCSTIKRATGQIDDTTLPGQRSEILPPDQQVARDPNVQGNPGVPGANGQIATNPINPPAQQQVAGNMQRAATPSTGNCDPKVDLCPEPLAPDPVAPVSPVKPITPMANKGTGAGKTLVNASKTVSGKPLPPGTPPTTVKVASKPSSTAQDAANGNLAAGQVLVDPNAPAAPKKSMAAAKKPAVTTVATAPVDGAVPAKPVVKKKKKKPVAAASATAPAAPGAPAAAAPAVPAAPQPQGQ